MVRNYLLRQLERTEVRNKLLDIGLGDWTARSVITCLLPHR